MKKILLLTFSILFSLHSYTQTYNDGSIQLEVWVHKVWSSADCSESLNIFTTGSEPVFKDIRIRVPNGIGGFDYSNSGLQFGYDSRNSHQWLTMGERSHTSGGWTPDATGFKIFNKTYNQNQVPNVFEWKIGEAYEKDACGSWNTYRSFNANPFSGSFCLDGDDKHLVNSTWQSAINPFRSTLAGEIGYVQSDALDGNGSFLFGDRDDRYAVMFAYRWNWVTPLPPVCAAQPQQDGPITLQVRLKGLWSDSDYDFGASCVGGIGDEELRLKYRTRDNGGSFGSWTSAPNISQPIPDWNVYGSPPVIFNKTYSTTDVNFESVELDFEMWEEDGCGADDEFNTCSFPSNLGNDDDAHYPNTEPNKILKWRDSPPNTWNALDLPMRNGLFRFSNYSVWVEYRWTISSPSGTIANSGGFGTGTIYNRVMCSGTNTTITANTDAATYFQWQVSDLSGGAGPSCNGSAIWTDISGETCPSYIPPQTPGTRVYRLKLMNRAGSGSTSNSGDRIAVGYAPCVRVSYFPYAPPIESNVCGGAVFAGGTYAFSLPQANDLDGVVNQSSISWTVTPGGASITGGTTHNASITFPSTTGTYTVRATVTDACGAANAFTTCAVNVVESSCGFLYVSLTGSDAGTSGSASQPKATLAAALASSSSSTSHIRLEAGVFNESNKGEILHNGTIIEGGFIRSGSTWTKSAGRTDIVYTNSIGTEETPSSTEGHRIGLKVNGPDNWTLKDVNISTANITKVRNSRGYSNYAIWVKNSTGFKIVNSDISAGNAANGSAGGNGSTSVANGLSGGNGSNGSCDGGHGNGGAGASAVGPSGVRRSGSGGNGGRGGTEGDNYGVGGNIGANGGGGAYRGGGGGGGNTHGCSGGGTGAWGGNGANGAAGASGGSQPGAPGLSGDYYTPAGQAAQGSYGAGGAGGGGGGGGAGQGGIGCDDGGGNGAGGGGSGGAGGNYGTGGYGGGGSFGIYLRSSSGTYYQSSFEAGAAGTGGSGGIGSYGGAQGGRGVGASNCSSEVGIGGWGGLGGSGGKGGDGQQGANGRADNVANVSSTFSNGGGTADPAANIAATYIQGCTNSVITMDKSSQTVRYLRIEQNKNDHINLREIQAFDLGGTNQAQGKPTNSSSNWPSEVGCGTTGDYGCQNLVDNLFDDSPGGLYHTGFSGIGEWVEIDMTGSYVLDYIRIHNRGNCCQARADNLKLILKDASGKIVSSTIINAGTSGYTDIAINNYTWSSFPSGGNYVDNLSENETGYGNSVFASEIFYTSTGVKDIVTSAGTVNDMFTVDIARDKPVIDNPSGGIEGRYVRITQNANENINLHELQVFNSSGTNISSGDVVITSHPNGSYPASNLTDNTLTGNPGLFQTGSAGIGRWVEVDLGGASEIDNVRIYNRYDCCKDRSSDLTLTVYDENHCEIYARPIDAYEGYNVNNSAYITNFSMPRVLCGSAALFLESSITDPTNREEVKWEIQRLTGPTYSRTNPGPSVATRTTEDPGAVTIPTGGNGLTGGVDLFQIKLQVRDACCGWSVPVYQEVIVTPDISSSNDIVSPDDTYCSTSADPGAINADALTSGCYVWQVSVNGGAWADASGSFQVEDYDPAALTLVGGVSTTYEYRRVARRFSCVDTSDAITYVIYPEIADNNLPADFTLCAGVNPDPITTTIPTGGNGTNTYTWQQNVNSGGWVTAAGTSNQVNYDHPTYALIGGVVTTYQFRRNVNSDKCSNTSNIITVTVYPAITGNTLTQPNPTTYCGDNATMSTILGSASVAGGDGVNYAFQWAYSVNGGGYQAAVGETGASYTTPSVPLLGGNTTTYEFKRFAYSAGCADETAVTVPITVVSPESRVQLFGSNLNLQYECEQNGWVYYTDDNTNFSNFYFAVEKGTNTFTSEVNLTIRPDVIWDVKIRNNAGPQKADGSFVMRRYWNVNVTSGSISTPTKVRFFYNDADQVATIAKRDLEMAAYPNSTPGAWDWFKTVDADFIYSLINNGNRWGHFNNFKFAPADVSYGIENGVRYVELSNITSFSGGTGGVAFGQNNPVLPVELVSLSATGRDRDILVEWVTATEINNEKFEVYRSDNAAGGFTKIGEVTGNGNTTEIQRYNFVDDNVETNKLYYYKLNQIDFDGSNEWTDVVSAIISSGDQIVIGELVPNPANSYSSIEIISPYSKDFTLLITNMLGQEVDYLDYRVEPGTQKIIINVDNMVPGNYLIIIQSQDGLEATRKLQVIK